MPWTQRKPMSRGSSELKRSRMVLGRKRMNKRGPKTDAWDTARAWLKIQFVKVGIQTCQLKFAGCWFDNALSFCHPAKRRNLQVGELYVVALGCTPCHDQLEVMAPEDMRRIVEALFNLTGIKIPK